MNCLSPLNIERPNGLGNKDRIVVQCGKCPACLSNRRKNWAFRLEQEFKSCSSAYFVTLTYDDNQHIWGWCDSEERFTINDAIGMDDFTSMRQQLSKRDIQLFVKRLRKSLDDMRSRYKKIAKVSQIKSEVPRIKYFISGEYGTETFRPHYHAIIFNLPFMYLDKIHEFISSSWQKGYVNVGTVSAGSIMYCTKYLLMESIIDMDLLVKPFLLVSTRPAIGIDYIEKCSSFNINNMANYAVKDGGVKVSLPRYYKDKIFSKYDKEELSYLNEIEINKNFNESEIGKYEIVKKEQYKKNLKSKIIKNNKL